LGWRADGFSQARLAAFDHVQSVIFWQIFWQMARGSGAEKRFGWWA
jgi:hypothetical protein